MRELQQLRRSPGTGMTVRRASVARPAVSSLSADAVRRASSCACGGSCPRCQVNAELDAAARRDGVGQAEAEAGHPFAAVANDDMPTSSYLPGSGERKDKGQPLEPWAPGPPVDAEPGYGMPGPGAAKTKPPELPIIAGLHRKLSVRQGPVPLTNEIFGLTVSDVSTENMHIAPAPTVDAYIVNGDMAHKIEWNVHDVSGPLNQIDITSPTDPEITADNYRDVAHDLMPGPGGAPPRERFFASDLTSRHELFHVARHVRYYREGLALGLEWLNGHTARSLGQVTRLFERTRKKIAAYGTMKTQSSLEEDDAYAAGAHLYQARSDEILRRGRDGNYP